MPGDGGDARAFSQLEIMGNIMHRLNWDKESNGLDTDSRPCAYFDLIGGSGTGGLLAILFARLCMSVDEVSEEFWRINEEVYEPSDLNPLEKNSRLRHCMEDILNKRGIPLDTKLEDETRRERCYGFVVASLRYSFESKVCLRTYPIQSQRPSDITIIEAVLATCATQPEFPPVSVGQRHKKREYTGAGLGANNPVYEAIAEAHSVFGGGSQVASLLSLGVGHPGTVVLDGDDTDPQIVLQNIMKDCERRAQEIQQQIGRVGIYTRVSVEQGMQRRYPTQAADPSWIITQTDNYLNSHDVCEKLDNLVWKFLAESGPITLDQLKHAGGSSTGQSSTAPEKALDILVSNRDEALMAKLMPHDLEYEWHISECLEGTRQDIIEQIESWVKELVGPNIAWIKGYPGVGKSAIAASLIEKYRSLGCLGSSFGFCRERSDTLTPNTMWRKFAYDLARRYPTIRKYLVNTLGEDETIPTISNTESLFRLIIQGPLTKCEETPHKTPIVLIIDALDECGGLDGQQSAKRISLMRTISDWSRLPSRFKLIVTSRGENDIENLFSKTSHQLIDILSGEQVDKRSSDDIRLFLTYHLRQIAAQYPTSLSFDWPGYDIIDSLTDKAGGLFIWAETTIRFITQGEPWEQLYYLLQGNGVGNIATLYQCILRTAFSTPSEKVIEGFREILGAIILAKVPLPISSFVSFLLIESSTVEFICNRLRSVIDARDVLRINHQSFADFLMDPEACPSTFFIDRWRGEKTLTLACLRGMERDLRFNICDLDSSYLRNSEVRNLSLRVDQHISLHLSYACRFWAAHLTETLFDHYILELLDRFMDHQFLFWLEVLSLTRNVNCATDMLRSLTKWIQAYGGDELMANDMGKFVAAFANIISQSAPHIYLSALPFSPRNSVVRQRYIRAYPQTIVIRSGGQKNWPAIQQILTGHSREVNSVSFSSDGKRIISGSEDKTIRIWDAETGEPIGHPLRGHSQWVTSVCLSPNGRLVISGSYDKTIRIWDTDTGEPVGRPLIGHDSWVNSVAFSSDGKYVISGSDDTTIRVWDVATGGLIMRPLVGHSSSISSIVPSPNGCIFVSGSYDHTLRIWSTKGGEMIGKPLTGHDLPISSVAFSPDSRSFVSGSYDKAILTWDAQTGKLFGEPLIGHRRPVSSVAFSPDGKYIVSGSQDKTIRLWNVETNKPVGEPLRGHADWVNSVSFSPDGRRIVSGSEDKTVRIWEAASSNASAELLNGHEEWVNSVAFSPDGRRIASGSNDRTVRVWNAETGVPIGGPLRGHENWVRSVAFSPDGRCLASGSRDRTIRVWDTDTGQLALGPLRGHELSVTFVKFSPNGRLIASGSEDGTILIWDTKIGEPVWAPLKGHDNSVSSVAFSPDGTKIVSGSGDKTVRIWNVEGGEPFGEPLRGHVEWITSVAYSPDGNSIASGSGDNTIRLWNVETGELIGTPLRGHNLWISSVAFSPDSRYIISGSGDDTIRMWDAKTGRLVGEPLRGHDKSVSSVSFSPDGYHIVSGSHDNTIRVWGSWTSNVIKRRMGGNTPSVKPASSSPDIRRNGITSYRLEVPPRKVDTTTLLNTPVLANASMTEDGWILGPNDELVLWVPPDIRTGICWPGRTLIIGNFITTFLDLRFFVYGAAWTRCKENATNLC